MSRRQCDSDWKQPQQQWNEGASDNSYWYQGWFPHRCNDDWQHQQWEREPASWYQDWSSHRWNDKWQPQQWEREPAWVSPRSKETTAIEQIVGAKIDPENVFYFLEAYERTLPYDTFTPQTDDSVLQPAPRSRCHVRDDDKESKRVCMRLHTGSPVRREFSARMRRPSCFAGHMR